VRRPYRAAGDTVAARPVDRVSVKGKSAPIVVYELLGLKDEVGMESIRLAELHKLGLESYRGRDWAGAIGRFKEIIRLKPGDGPATALLRRCREFAVQRPAANWDGVNHMDSK